MMMMLMMMLMMNWHNWQTLIPPVFQHHRYYVCSYCSVLFSFLLCCLYYFLRVASSFLGFYPCCDGLFAFPFHWCSPCVCALRNMFCDFLWVCPCYCGDRVLLFLLLVLCCLHSIIFSWVWTSPCCCFCNSFRIHFVALGFVGSSLGDIVSCFCHWWFCLIHSGVLSSSHLPFLVVLLFSGMGSLQEVQ